MDLFGCFEVTLLTSCKFTQKVRRILSSESEHSIITKLLSGRVGSQDTLQTIKLVDWSQKQQQETSGGVKTKGYLNYFPLDAKHVQENLPIGRGFETAIQGWISAYHATTHETRAVFEFIKTSSMTKDDILSYFTSNGAGSPDLSLFQDDFEARDAISHLHALKHDASWKFTEFGRFDLLCQVCVQEPTIIAEARPEAGEFDVVKKQRTITEATLFAGADVSEALLGDNHKYFYQFSSIVMEALEATHYLEARIINEEQEWMSSDSQCLQTRRVGHTYAAINDGFKEEEIVKIGATTRDTPLKRLKELSRCTPTDYVLIASIQSHDPFAVERLCHQHFQNARICRASTGRKTEFFHVSKKEVEEYFANINMELRASQDFLDL